MIGSTALACVEHAPHRIPGEKVVRRRKRRPAELPASRSNGIPEGTCRRCGVVGVHPIPEACIDALRDRIATLELREDRAAFPLSAEPTRSPEELAAAPAPAVVPMEVSECDRPAPERSDGKARRCAKPARRRISTDTEGTMNAHYSAVLADLEMMKADAENGIIALRRLVARDSPVTPTAPRTARRAPVSDAVIQFLDANRGEARTVAEIAAAIGHAADESIRRTVNRLARTKRIARSAGSKFRSKLGPTGDEKAS